MLITRKSKFTGVTHTIDIPVDISIYNKWLNNGFGNTPIQSVFPGLSANQREFLLSGCTPEEWDELFNDEKDNEED